jgi:nucleotide-binding universal stress UspA family protein
MGRRDRIVASDVLALQGTVPFDRSEDRKGGLGTMLEHVLVPLDGSPLAECVLPHVVALARALDTRITLLRVLEHAPAAERIGSVDPLGWYINEAEGKAYLNGWTGRLQETGLRVESALLEGQAAGRIIEFAGAHDVDLIVLSSHGRSGLSGWNVSSIVQKIIMRAYAPVMIVRAYQAASVDLTALSYKRMLVPLDCSQRAECVLPVVTALARFYGAQLLLAHVVRRPEIIRRVPLTRQEIELTDQLTEHNRQEASKYLEQLQSRLDVDVRTILLVGDSSAAVLHDVVEQEGVDIVLLSAHGYSGSTKWPYGSVVINFIGYGTTPLLIMQDLSPDELERTKAEMLAREHKGH